jgi:hypothetical protein
LDLSVNIFVGFYARLGFIKVRVTVFERTWSYKKDILVLKLQPKPFKKIGTTSSNGDMSLGATDSDLTCVSKGGSVGAEGARVKLLSMHDMHWIFSPLL